MKHNQLRIGVLLSYANLALGMIIPLFYTPIMLKMLGQAEYGLYSLSSSVISYLSLLTLGFGSTIVRYISKYRAENDQASLEKAYGFFLTLYCGVGIVAMLVGVLIQFNIEHIFDQGLSLMEIQKMRTLVLIMSFNTALSFPISVFSAVIASHERFFYEKLLNILSTAMGPIANLTALYLGHASVGMAVASTILQLVFMPMKVVYCCRVLKLKPRFGKLPGALIREMVGFSFFTFLATLVDMLFWATDKVILGMLAGTAAVAIYNVGGTFNTIVIGLSTSISGILVPRITGMVVNQTPKSEWTNLFIRVGRLQFLIIGLIISGFSVFGRPFLILWAGPEYAGAFWVAVLTLFPLCVPLIQNTGLCIITAQNKHQFRSVVYLIIAIVNVVSTYLVVPRFGYIGAAVCSCAAYVVGQGFVMNIYYYKVTGLDIPLFWKNILKMAVIPGIQMAAGLFLAERFPLTNWFTFFAGVAAYSIVYALLMYFLVMNDYEKDILRKPLMKLFRR